VNARTLWGDGWAVVRARWCLRHATSLGRRVRVWGWPAVHVWSGQLLVADRVMIMSTVATTAIDVMGTLEIGERAFINYGGSISAEQLVRIGPRCSLGPHVMIMDNGFHRLEPDRRDERPESRPVVLEENVWLGARAIVLPGVTIGAHSVIGAGSVVTRDIPPRSLAAGLPARVIRTL